MYIYPNTHLKVAAPSRWGHYDEHNVYTKQKYDREYGSEYSCKMKEGNRDFLQGKLLKQFLLMKTAMMKIVIVDSLGNTDDGIDDRIDHEGHQIDTDDGTGDIMDPEFH